MRAIDDDTQAEVMKSSTADPDGITFKLIPIPDDVRFFLCPYNFTPSTMPGIARFAPSLSDISESNELKFHQQIDRWVFLARLVLIHLPNETYQTLADNLPTRLLAYDSLKVSTQVPETLSTAKNEEQVVTPDVWRTKMQIYDLEENGLLARVQTKKYFVGLMERDLQSNQSVPSPPSPTEWLKATLAKRPPRVTPGMVRSALETIIFKLDQGFSKTYASDNLGTLFPAGPSIPFYQPHHIGKTPLRDGLNTPFFYIGDERPVFAIHREDVCHRAE